MAERVTVQVSEPYDVLLGAGLDLGETVSGRVPPGEGAILTDSTVGPLYAGEVRRSLEAAGWRVAEPIEVPAGESSKSLGVYAGVVSELSRSRLPRDGTLFALGGGVVGDLGGFVAATYLRGVGFVGLPTSLLAMVDSSVGGKVGVDLPEGKNLVGSFLRPRLVAADTRWLGSLPGSEVSAGLAEVVKMGLLAGGGFFRELDRTGEARSGGEDALQSLVSRSVRFKAGVVAGDEYEGGRRAILNYGHTVGHGLEAAAGYLLSHGEAVAAGMVAAARVSSEVFGTDLSETHEELLVAAGLPRKVPAVEVGKVFAAMRRDKKRRSGDAPGDYRFVLLEDLGEPVWGVRVAEDQAARAVEGVLER